MTCVEPSVMDNPLRLGYGPLGAAEPRLGNGCLGTFPSGLGGGRLRLGPQLGLGDGCPLVGEGFVETWRRG